MKFPCSLHFFGKWHPWARVVRLWFAWLCVGAHCQQLFEPCIYPCCSPHLPLQVAAAGGAGSVVISAGCLLAFGALTQMVTLDLSIWAMVSGIPWDWDWALLGNEEAVLGSELDPDNRVLGQPQDSFLARHWRAACDVPLEEKHAVSMINGPLEKKAELSKIFDMLDISLIFHLFLNDLRQTLLCCCWPL